MLRERAKVDAFMGMARRLAQLSTCDRKQVGAIIIKDGRCISWGFNGAPPGLPHCEENNHGYLDPYYPGWSAEQEIEEKGCRNSTHAESNAVAFAARQGISTDGATLFVTVSPCETCARLLIAAGIRTVIFWEAYRDPAGAKMLQEAGLWVGAPGLGECEFE